MTADADTADPQWSDAALRDGIRKAVEKATGEPAIHSASTRVIVKERCGTWEGLVETFQTPLGTVFGWAVSAGPEPRFFAVIQRLSITTPIAAIQAWIAAGAP